MDQEEIKRLLDETIAELYKNDYELIRKVLNERTIAHRFANYLEAKFKDYIVDCEYNGDVDDEVGKKRINVLKDEYYEVARRVSEKFKEKHADDQQVQISVYPDIIVHRRGTNEHNLLIIELKKSNAPEDEKRFDDFKMQRYTSPNYGNHLEYQMGANVEFHPTEPVRISIYENGQVIDNYTLPLP